MLNNRGVLVSRKGRRAVILTNDGDFKSVRLRRSVRLSVGQTVRSEHLSHFKSLLHYIMAPVLAFSFSLLCFAPLTQSTIESGEPEPAAYVNFEFASGIEASIDRNLNIISVRTADNKYDAFISELGKDHNMSFGKFTEILIGKISRNGELHKGTSLLFSTFLTKQIAGRDRKQFNDKLIHTFIGHTIKLIPGSTFQSVPAAMSNRTAPGGQVVSAVNGQLHYQKGQPGTIMSVMKLKTLSVSGIEKVMPSFITPLQKLMEKIKGTGEILNRSEIERASYQLNAVPALFKNPFSNMEQSRESGISGYLFSHQNLPSARQGCFGLREV